MNFDYSVPVPLLRFLGACVYGDAGAYYEGLGEAERAELEAQGKKYGFRAWFYRYLCDVLPETKKAEYQNLYRTMQIKAMMGERELKRLYGVLTEYDLRFVPIKGADLAFRVYPDAALRVFGDWDIWFHPDDCERALVVLKDDGWTLPEQYADKPDALREKTSDHHFARRRRGSYEMEPHFTLTNFNGCDPHELWEGVCPCDGVRHVLSPEMNMLMLSRHAASRSYYHASLPKLLTDMAMVMRSGKVDFSRLHQLANRFHLPYPGDLLAAFPEFFPAEVLRTLDADQEKAAVFRSLFDCRGSLGEPEDVSLVLSRCEACGNVMGGLLERIRKHDPATIRRIYRLPDNGAWGRVAWAYLCWFWTRSWSARVWLQRKKKLREYGRIVESIESRKPCPDKTLRNQKG